MSRPFPLLRKLPALAIVFVIAGGPLSLPIYSRRGDGLAHPSGSFTVLRIIGRVVTLNLGQHFGLPAKAAHR